MYLDNKGNEKSSSSVYPRLFDHLAQIALENFKKRGVVHSRFLESRRASLQQMGKLIQLQISARNTVPLFSEYHLREFASGSIVNCFGSDYQVFKGRRVSRIPNGDFRMISRVMLISGRRQEFNEVAGIAAEYDVPVDTWYYRDNAFPYMPYSLYMEIALQACGFLSAYLGTPLISPEQDLYFRNLDGNARLLSTVDLRGRTVICKGRLLSTVVSSGTILQKFDFELICGKKSIYKGETIFGYFQPQVMVDQVGLDGGKATMPGYRRMGRANSEGICKDGQLLQSKVGKSSYRLAGGYLDLLDDVIVVKKGGTQRMGYVYASKEVNPQDWFFERHFYQDPVMPGSLGIEAIITAIQAYALECDLGNCFKLPRFGLVEGNSASWKYRGQLTPKSKKMELEVNITRIERTHDQVSIWGDASLWADDVRIYEVKNAAIRLLEAQE